MTRNADSCSPCGRDANRTPGSFFKLPFTEAKAQLVADFERAAIAAALNQCAGNVSAAARQLGIHRQNLQQKIVQLEICR